MSFPIVFSSNSSPTIKVDKDLTEVVTVTGTLRGTTSILDPVVAVESSLTADIVSRINYAYIEQFNRYYYVTDITSEVTGLWVISMHVDVLMTYKAGIRAQNAVVSRQSGQYNLMLDDGWFMAYQNPRHQLKLFSNESPFETQEFCLVVAGS